VDGHDGEQGGSRRVVSEVEEMGVTLWGSLVSTCPVCLGAGRRTVGEGEITVKGWRGRRLRRARVQRCALCKGAGLVVR
jgi:hypothetical protein